MDFCGPILARVFLSGCAIPGPRTPAAFNAVLKRDPADVFAHLAVAGTYDIQRHHGDRMARKPARIRYGA